VVIGMAKIQIQQTSAALQIASRFAKLQVNRSQKTQLTVKQNAAQMNLETQHPKIQIDQTECFASSGLKTPLRMADDFYQRSLSAGLEAISSIVEEGLRFLRIEEGGSPIRDMAAARGVYTKQISVQAMPSERPQITVEPGSVRVDWVPHSIDMSWDVMEADVEFIPHQVNVDMETDPSIEISVANED